jgi:hypothetical protein
MRSSARLLSLALPGLLLLVPGAGSGEVIERIVAVVDGRPLLLSEVRLLQQVRGDTEEATRAALIDEWLMFAEAARLPQLAPTPEEEARALKSLELRAPGPTPPAEEDLRRVARRQATILKYVDFRFRPQVRVEEAAVAALYAAEYPTGTPPLADVADKLRARLLARDLDRRIEEWVKELRSGADIRYN